MFDVVKHGCLSLCTLILSVFLCVIFSIDVELQEVCNETISGCCPGYFRSNKNNSCKLCMPGYTGINCTKSCPYPTYGQGCQSFCDCNKDICDVSTGCEPNTACMPGYFGINCTRACPYPGYGHGCKGACDCDEDICDVSTGCTQITTENTSSLKTTIFGNNDCNLDCKEGMCDVSTGCGPITTETLTNEEWSRKSNTNQILLFFIALVGCIDIILLSAYVILCIHDQRRRQKEIKFSAPGQQSSGRCTAYENIEFVSFFAPR